MQPTPAIKPAQYQLKDAKPSKKYHQIQHDIVVIHVQCKGSAPNEHCSINTGRAKINSQMSSGIPLCQGARPVLEACVKYIHWTTPGVLIS
eukprot:11710595-Ditylum_brightwellii.AAC.1